MKYKSKYGAYIAEEDSKMSFTGQHPHRNMGRFQEGANLKKEEQT